jgi:hypothetical protein
MFTVHESIPLPSPATVAESTVLYFVSSLEGIFLAFSTVFHVEQFSQRLELSGAPDALLRIESGIHQRLIVRFGRMLVESGGSLSAKVSVARIEVESGNTVLAAHAGEAHAAVDSFGGVVSH